MAHEELKNQWDKDVEQFGEKDAVKLWQFKDPNDDDGWQQCDPKPMWFPDNKYRRKEPPFTPEYFSGLNYEKAEQFIGRTIECSYHGRTWRKGVLLYIDTQGTPFNVDFDGNDKHWCEYLRTCPETFQPTITIGDKELPRPEHIEPFAGTHYFSVYNGNVIKRVWSACPHDMERLRAGNVHRKESRAQAWADWWQDTVIKKLKDL